MAALWSACCTSAIRTIVDPVVHVGLESPHRAAIQPWPDLRFRSRDARILVRRTDRSKTQESAIMVSRRVVRLCTYTPDHWMEFLLDNLARNYFWINDCRSFCIRPISVTVLIGV